MKYPLLSFMCAMVAAEASDFAELRRQASAAYDVREHKRAIILYHQAVEAALAGNDQYSAFDGLATVSGIELHARDYEGAIRSTKRAIEIADALLPRLEERQRQTVQFGRIECRGFLDRALSVQGRIAEGYAEVRAIWRDIGRYRMEIEGGAEADAREGRDMHQWSAALRSLFWRTTTREAEYLDIMGRTNEAVAMLRNASNRIDEAESIHESERFYAGKVRPALAGMVDFLGYSKEAISIQRASILDGKLPLRGASAWGARLNLLRNIGQYDGPTRELVNQAEKCQKHIASAMAGGVDPISAVVVEKMRADLDANYDLSGNLRRLSNEMRSSGMLFDGPYADRAALVAEANRPGLDGKFLGLLNEMRSHGNKRAEPTLYREFAAYLVRTGRPAEGLPLFREALRLTESFGWSLHTPRLRLAIIGTFCELRDFAAAEAEWATLERDLAAIPDLPPERQLEVRVARIEWHLIRGEKELAQAALKDAREFATQNGITPWLRRTLDRLDLDQSIPSRAALNAHSIPVSLQPSRVETSAAIGDPLRARFTLRNPDGRPRTGEFFARGPAIQMGLGNAPRQITGVGAAGGAENEIRFALVLAPGESLGVALDMKGTPSEAQPSKWQMGWRDTVEASSAEWRVATEPDPFVVSVLNANLIRKNAFHPVTFSHQIVRRSQGEETLNYRFVGSTPLRIEYYDPHSRRLVAADANGNGSFSDPGDVLISDSDRDLKPDVHFQGADRLREIEVAVFSKDGTDTAGKQHIRAELYIDDQWETAARNELE